MLLEPWPTLDKKTPARKGEGPCLSWMPEAANRPHSSSKIRHRFQREPAERRLSWLPEPLLRGRALRRSLRRRSRLRSHRSRHRRSHRSRHRRSRHRRSLRRCSRHRRNQRRHNPSRSHSVRVLVRSMSSGQRRCNDGHATERTGRDDDDDRHNRYRRIRYRRIPAQEPARSSWLLPHRNHHNAWRHGEHASAQGTHHHSGWHANRCSPNDGRQRPYHSKPPPNRRGQSAPPRRKSPNDS